MYRVNFVIGVVFVNITANGLGICEDGAIEAQMFSFAQMHNRIPNVENCR